MSAFRTFTVRLHATSISFQEPTAALEQFGVIRPHQAVFQWVHHIAEEASDPPMTSLLRKRQ